MGLKENKKAFAKFSLLILLLVAVFGFSLQNVSAAHEAIVTVDPSITNCDMQGNTFTISVENDGGGTSDSILQVEIYKATQGLSDFDCGQAPSGWMLFSFTDRCIYVTGLNSPDKIAHGESLDFTFDAVMSSDSCYSSFTVVTVDDQIPGVRNTYVKNIDIDCNAPELDKKIGEPLISGDGFDWITQDTQIDASATENAECDLGLDYCEIVYTVDEGGEITEVHDTFDPETFSWDYSWSFDEDSVHDVTIRCVDVAGNEKTIEETDKVDSTPPETTKTYGEPHFPFEMVEDQYPHWITLETPITLEATDGGEICAIGVKDTYYYDTIVDNSYCEDVEACNPVCVQPSVDKSVLPVCDWQVYLDPFTKDEESCHILQYYSMDGLGNVEPMKWQCVYVDDTEPVLEKVVNRPTFEGNDPNTFPETNGVFHWVTPESDIVFRCEDQIPHPVGNEELVFKVSYDLADDGYLTEKYCDKYEGEMEEDWCVVPNSNPFTFNFDEDSVHDLEYYCRDALGLSTEQAIQYYKVDSTAPTITPEIYSGPSYGTCDLDDPAGDCWIQDTIEHEGTHIHTHAVDGGEICAIDEVQCKWGYYLDGVMYGSGYSCDGADCDISFEDETEHQLYVECTDKLGNTARYEKTFFVDSSGPEVDKQFIGPQKIEEGVEWIDGVTTIELTSKDLPDAPCASGADEIYYIITPMDDKYCYNPEEFCRPLQYNDPQWNTYSEPISGTPESCHIIEFYGVDKLGNIGEHKTNCFFVDKTHPETTKTYRPEAYVDEDGNEYIDTQHQIILSATDPEPHPSGVKDTFYTVTLMEDNSKCENKELCIPIHSWEDDVWTTYEEPFGIDQQSCHMIEYYSIDSVDKKEPVKSQCVFVDKEGPTIHKTYFGSQSPDPITEETPYPHYINSDTRVQIDAVDEGPHPSGVAKAEYKVTLLKDNNACMDDEVCQEQEEGVGDWLLYKDPFNIVEDSCHMIEIKVTDNVGKFTYHRQCVFVDNKAPIIEKEITGLQLDAEEPVHKYITQGSIIKLTCADPEPHPVGNEIIHWEMYWKYDDCWNDENWGGPIDAGTEEGNYKEFTGLKDSCHKFVYWCEDALGNTQEVPETEIDVVDNTSPTPNKTVSEPSTEWYPVDVATDPFNPDATHFYSWIVDKCWNNAEDSIDCWKVTLDTPISMDCQDPEPHPVGNEQVCFNVELDAEDATYNYCRAYNGKITYDEETDTNYCCVDNVINNFKFKEESEHNLKYYCIDALGNKGPVDDEKFKVTGKMFKIKLNDKWNLISVPFVLLNDNPDEVFKNTDSVQTVWSYDAASDKWSVYRPGEDYGTNNLESIEPGLGYWVLSDCNETTNPYFFYTPQDFREGCGPNGEGCEMLVVGGSLYNPGPVTPPSQSLAEGWNLIGYYGTEGRYRYAGPDAWYFFDDTKEAYCELYSLRNLDGGFLNPTKWSALVGYWEPSNPHQWEGYGFCDQMDPGAGYWVSMDEEGTYKPETVCDQSILQELMCFFN